MLLKVEQLNVYYGAIHALKGISLEVNEGEIVTLIGANGAGKSTTLNAICGLLRARSGSITYRDQSLIGCSVPAIVKAGISQVPEGRRIFPNLTVKENLELGAFLRRDRQAIRESIKDVYQRFPRLEERQKQMAGTLSGGEQQMLAIGRALMSRPQLMLLDEPSMGLAPVLVQEIFNIIREINKQGTTILVVEQNAHMALSVANRGYVLETGRIVLHGSATELANSEEVKKAYLGR